MSTKREVCTCVVRVHSRRYLTGLDGYRSVVDVSQSSKGYPVRLGSWRPFHVGCSVCMSSISIVAESPLNLATSVLAGFLIER